MKFENFKKSLQSKLENCYILWGEDRYLMSNAISNLLAVVHSDFDDLNVSYFDESSAIDDILSSVNTLPFGSEWKVVVVRDWVFNESNINLLKKYLKNPNPQGCLLFTTLKEPQLNGSEPVDCNKLGREILRKKIIVELRQKNVQIEEGAITQLLDYCDNDMGRIMQELDKLVAVVGGGGIINKSHIEVNINKSQTYGVFELTDALGKQESDKAIRILDNLLKSDTKGLSNLIYNYFRRLMYTSMCSEHSDNEIAIALKVKPYSIKISREQGRLFGTEKLVRICEYLAGVDERTKTTFASMENELYNAVFEILLM